MELTGKETIQGSVDDVWQILMDTTRLAAITPGISELVETGDNTYQAIANVKIGPVKGSFSGEMVLTNVIPGESFDMSVEQKSKIGNVKALIHLELTPCDDQSCELAFNGKAQMSGLLARTGARVMTGVSNSLTKQFFENLNKALTDSEEVA